MNEGQCSVGAAGPHVGVISSWRSEALAGHEANCCGLGWSGPALLASGVSESRHWGAAGRTSLFACGRLGRRDERARQVLQYIPRSLVSAPAVHHSVSRWRRPAAGWAGRIDNPLRSRTNARENPGDCQHWKENERGSKLFRRKFTQALTGPRCGLVFCCLEIRRNCTITRWVCQMAA
jgi:hypothetical protein